MPKIKNIPWLLIIVIAVSVFLHTIFISYPPKPVLDEVYFATGALSYYTGNPYFDIHPPLGKLIYSLPLFVRHIDANNIEYTTLPKIFSFPPNAPETEPVFISSFLNFPYVDLRLISALFGVLLTVAVYLFVKTVTGDRFAALLGAFFITFDNAIFLETRLILLNGQYLAFGFFSLWFLLKERGRPVVAGILLGCALAIKFTTVLFIIVPLFGLLLKRNGEPLLSKHNVVMFFLSSIIVFLSIILFVNNVFIQPEKRAPLLQNFFAENSAYRLEKNDFLKNYGVTIPQKITTPIAETLIGVEGYIAPNTLSSSSTTWFNWIIGDRDTLYFLDTSNNNPRALVLASNKVTWIAVTIVVLFSLFWLVLRKKISGVVEIFTKTPIALFGLSYLAALTPFFLLSRPTALYHYFPALIFGFCLVAYVASQCALSRPKWQRISVFAFIIISTIIGFLVKVGGVYGVT